MSEVQAKVNFSGRRPIRHEDVRLEIEPDEHAIRVTGAVDVSALDLPEEARVIVELYREIYSERHEVKLADLAQLDLRFRPHPAPSSGTAAARSRDRRQRAVGVLLRLSSLAPRTRLGGRSGCTRTPRLKKAAAFEGCRGRAPMRPAQISPRPSIVPRARGGTRQAAAAARVQDRPPPAW